MGNRTVPAAVRLVVLRRCRRPIVRCAGLLGLAALVATVAGCGSEDASPVATDPPVASTAPPPTPGNSIAEPPQSQPTSPPPRTQSASTTAASAPSDSGPNTTVAAPTTTESALPGRIRCDTYYRPDFEKLEGAEERAVTLPREDAESATGVTETYPHFVFRGAFAGESIGGQTVTVSVATNDGQPLVSVLYQVGGRPELLAADFPGGHGFTGLHYVRNGAAQLQFFCRAEYF